jgi:hypothetical protein
MKSEQDYHTFGQQNDASSSLLSILELKARIDQQNGQITNLKESLRANE